MEYTTEQLITLESRLMADGAKRLPGGELALNIPPALLGDIPPGTDNNSCSLNVNIEKGVWIYHATGQKGNLKTLLDAYGIEAAATPSERNYQDRKEYALQHGVTWEVFAHAGWECEQKDNKDYTLHWYVRHPETNEPQRRTRYLNPVDGKRFTSPAGYQRGFYGLERTLEMDNKEFLIICNGEPSVVTAQYYGLPAFCMAGGENALPDNLLAILKAHLKKNPRTLLIAMDCDKKGQDTAAKLADQFTAENMNFSIVNMNLYNKGDLADFCRYNPDKTLENLLKHMHTQIEGVVDGDSEYDKILNVLNPEYIDDSPFLEFPFKSFHRYGGLAWMLKPRKLVYVIARTGGGKTSFFETVADRYALQGSNVLFWGDEWSWNEYMWRRITRRFGIPTTAWDAWNMHKIEVRDNIPLHKRRGLDLPQWLGSGRLPDGAPAQQRAEGIDILKDVTKWATSIRDSVAGNFHLFESFSSLDSLLASMGAKIHSLRAQNKPIAGVFFDYVQALPETPTESQRGQFEARLDCIKHFVKEYDVVGWVGSQINKAPSKEQKKGHVYIDSDDANYITTTAANLVLTLNVEYVEDETLSTEANQVYKPHPDGRAVIRIAKNSVGTPDAIIPMKFEGKRLLWLEADK